MLLYTSTLTLFRVGPGPSSSRSVGPQRAALNFVHALAADGLLNRTSRVDVHLLGGLASTGRAVGSDWGIVAGLCGASPEHCDAGTLASLMSRVEAEGRLKLGGSKAIEFDPTLHVRFHVQQALAGDANGVRFDARDAEDATLLSRLYVCGGDAAVHAADGSQPDVSHPAVPYSFESVAELLAICRERGKRITDIARTNEYALRSPDEVREGLKRVAEAMRASIERGLIADGTLPGSGARRRASSQRATLEAPDSTPAQRCSVYALAVAEENAAGGRVVSAPTNGSAGPVAALLEQWRTTTPLASDHGAMDFLLAAGAIGGLLRAAGLKQAGCQSAVGVAAAMAASGYAAVHGGSAGQVMLAAERALEPYLGLSCDPVAGRVQQPCIERNVAAAARAVAAGMSALRVPEPRVGLDGLIAAMIETGRGMAGRFKTASLGIALNVADC